MSNTINRQELSDYEKHIGAWRNLAKTYNAQVGTYNAGLNDYNAQASGFNSSVDAYNASITAYNNSITNPQYNTYTEPVYNFQALAPSSLDGTAIDLPQNFRKGDTGLEGSYQVVDPAVVDAVGNPTYKTEWRSVDPSMQVYSGQVKDTAANVKYDADGRPYIEHSWQEQITVARPGEAPAQPNITPPTNKPDPLAPRPEAPTMTLQQAKDIAKSDQPMVDAEKGEAGKFSPFKSEEGLIQRAMKGFK